VLASDRGLAELRGLGPELVSRISGGLICELAPPEFATRLGIVRQISDETGITIGDDAATFIAMQITAGARELRGAIHRLQAMSSSYNESISRALAERAVAELARHSTRAVRLADVQKVVCEAFGVEPAQLRSDRKGRAVAEPRMLAMWLARKYTRAPWSEIGQYFGRQSHSTVISAHKRVEKLIAQQGAVDMANQTCHVDEAIRRLETALRTA
jgi:chromosomal replication initiator protein